MSAIDSFIIFATHWLMPFMVVLFVGALALRLMVYYTVKRELWFSKEFEKRVDYFIGHLSTKEELSFYVITKKLLEKTFYELFEVRFYMKRRKPDFIMTWSDRVFLIKQGAAMLVHDLLKNIKPMKFHSEPKLFQTSKKVLAHNPSFSRVFGIFPASTLTEMLNMLSGIFIVLGVFGTFLGIMKALPALSGMDLGDAEGTKIIMDQFLIKIAFSMNTSLMGITFSVITSFFNSAFSPQAVFVSAVDRLESALDSLWNVSSHNEIPKDLTEFDENRSPEEVLAQKSLDKELQILQGAPKTRVA